MEIVKFLLEMWPYFPEIMVFILIMLVFSDTVKVKDACYRRIILCFSIFTFQSVAYLAFAFWQRHAIASDFEPELIVKSGFYFVVFSNTVSVIAVLILAKALKMLLARPAAGSEMR